MKRLLVILGVLALCASAFAQVSNIQQRGGYYASDFAYGWNNATPGLSVGVGNNVSGTYTITLNYGYTQTPTGLQFIPMNVNAPFTIGSGTSMETVAASSISAVSCSTPYVYQTCQVTATFANAHGAGDTVRSGTTGLQEAVNYAASLGGAKVVVDPLWTALGGTNVTLIGATPYPSVFIEDDRGPVQFWNPTPASTAFWSAPSALSSSTVFPVASPVGSYTTGTYHFCFAYVDIEGNEGPCSSDYSHAGLATSSIQFTAPPAQAGAVGWIPYIGLTGGAASNEYQVQLWTQPTVLGAAPVSNGVCALSPILLAAGHYACALTNATYSQTGSGAIVSALTTIAAPQAVGLGGTGTASYWIGNSNAHTTYQYAPGTTPATPGLVRSSLPFTAATAAGSTIPQVMGTVKLPANFMNYVGRTIEVCGYVYSSTQGASTVVQIALEWDAQGSDVTTGLPVLIAGPVITGTLTTGTTGQFDFCQDLKTTVASPSATGGTITGGHGYLTECALTTCATPFTSPTMTVAAVGSLNLAGEARIQVAMIQTTSTTAVPQLRDLTVKIIN